MAARNSQPIMTNTPRLSTAALSTANAAMDGTGTIVDALTACAEGTKIIGAIIQAVGFTTAGLVNVFYHNGSNYVLVDQIPVTAVATPNATTPAFRTLWLAPDSFDLPNASYKLAFAATIGSSFRITAIAADYS